MPGLALFIVIATVVACQSSGSKFKAFFMTLGVLLSIMALVAVYLALTFTPRA